MKKILDVLFVIFLVVGVGIQPASAQSGTAATTLKANASKAANLRAGPGIAFSVIGGVKANEELEIIGRNSAGSWLQIKKKSGLVAWIATFLVKNAPALDKLPLAQDQPVAAATPIPPSASAPVAAATPVATPTTVPVPAPVAPVGPEFGVSKQCGHFEYKLYDLRKVKSVWFYNKEYIAQGNFLLIFIEVKNISSGTSYFGQFGPRLLLAAPGQRPIPVDDSWRGSFQAGWMFQAGSVYDDVNPGLVLGEVEAYDLPLDRDFTLVYDTRYCPGQTISLGTWSAITKGSEK